MADRHLGRHRFTRSQTPELRHEEIVDGWRLAVLKAADPSDDVATGVFGVLDLVVTVVTNGFLGGGAVGDEARWLVQVAPVADPESTKTVRTTFSYRGARLAARRIRRTLASGDAEKIAALPDYLW